MVWDVGVVLVIFVFVVLFVCYLYVYGINMFLCYEFIVYGWIILEIVEEFGCDYFVY